MAEAATATKSAKITQVLLEEDKIAEDSEIVIETTASTELDSTKLTTLAAESQK